MSLSFRPAWQLNEQIGLSARFDVSGELTTPNATNRRVMVGDLSVSSSFGNLYTIPGADIGVSASTSLSFGTSPYSLAAGKLGGISGSVNAFSRLRGHARTLSFLHASQVATMSTPTHRVQPLSHVLLTDCSSDRRRYRRPQPQIATESKRFTTACPIAGWASARP